MYSKIPSFNDIDIRSEYTSTGMFSLSPWNDSAYEYSIGQLVLRSNSNSKLEVVSLLNINNISSYQMYYDMNLCEKQYKVKIYLGAQNSTAKSWNIETLYTPNLTWPESYIYDILYLNSFIIKSFYTKILDFFGLF